jgi:hypothetical protein
MTETWRDCVGYEGLYQVSCLGRVRSVAKVVQVTRRTRWGSLATVNVPKASRILKPNLDTGGYEQVVLYRGLSDKKTFAVHRLVLSSWVSPPSLLDHGMHLNDIRSDNRLANLRWGTKADNMRDMSVKGRVRSSAVGRPLTALDYLAIQAQPSAKLKTLAALYGRSKSGISKIRAKANF